MLSVFSIRDSLYSALSMAFIDNKKSISVRIYSNKILLKKLNKIFTKNVHSQEIL